MIAFSPESHTTWLSPYSHSYTTASLFVILMLRFPCVSRIPHTCATRLYHRSDISRQGCPQGAFSLCIVYAPLKASHALTFNCQGNPVLLQDTVCPPVTWRWRFTRCIGLGLWNRRNLQKRLTFYRHEHVLPCALCPCVFRQCNYTMTKKLMQIVVSLHF